MYGIGMWEQYEHAIEMSYWCMEMAKKKRAKEIVDMGLKVMFVEGETYNPIQLEYFNKAKDFLK